MQAHQTMPHNQRLELSVLSACVHFDTDREIVLDALSAEDFYVPANAELFSVIRGLHQRGSCDELLIYAAISGNKSVLEAFNALGVVITPKLDAVCTHLRALADARRITRAAFVAAAAGIEASTDPETFLDTSTRQLTDALQGRASKVKTALIGDLCAGLIARADEDPAEKASACLRTGLKSMDRVLTGLEPGRLYVVAGRPGMGKSALACQMAQSAAEQGARAAIFSLEMPAEEVTQRMVCAAARVNARVMDNRKLSELEARRYTNAAREIGELPIIFPQATSMTVEQITREARLEKLRGGLGCVVVDYLQLVRSSRRHDSREQEVSEISRELKLLARSLEVPVIAVSQLNRDVEKRGDKRPLMSDLRESGAIEQDADAILLIYREDYYDTNAHKGLAEIIVGKNRGGETGMFKAMFVAEHTVFRDLAYGEEHG